MLANIERSTAARTSSNFAAHVQRESAVRQSILAAETSTARATRLGTEGERAVGLLGPKVGIRIPGANNLRFPDNLTATTLTEVKNVRKQGFTGQLRDYVNYSKANNLDLDLFVRGSLHSQGPTTFTKPLADAIRRGDITPRYIPGTH
ncbi:MAG: hypothetical protein EOP06_32045 [Proteobacteria bacterium]|nr:MAG: hypothetical protein EOP06_32045 [Pseudomonadota bacterium]